MARDVDDLDRHLLAALADDGRQSVADLAQRAGVSRPTVSSRLRALAADGVLRIAGLIDPHAVRGLTTAFVGLTLDKYRLDEKVEQIAALDEVVWAAVVTGRYDIVVEVVTDRGMSGLYDFLTVSLHQVGGIESSEMFVVMKARNKWAVAPAGLRRAWSQGPTPD